MVWSRRLPIRGEYRLANRVQEERYAKSPCLSRVIGVEHAIPGTTTGSGSRLPSGPAHKKRFIRAASARAVLFLPPFPFPFRQFGMQEVRYFFNRFPFYPVAVPGPLRTSHPEFPGDPFREDQFPEFLDLLSTGYPDRLDPVGI